MAADSERRATREELPPSVGLRLDPSTRVLAEGRMLLGGAKGRAVRLSGAGTAALTALLAGGTDGSPASRRLARRLIEAGLAHPDPPPATPDGQVTVVIPVHERSAELRRCLAALDGLPVIVVDDGSRLEATAIVRACADYAATLVVRDPNAGPSSARNAGLALVATPFVAFVDSDVEVVAGWLDRLLGHMADPAVALAAPRVVGVVDDGAGALLRRYAVARCPLDLGPVHAAIEPGGRIGYVPSATMLVRRTALDSLDAAAAPRGAQAIASARAFDPDLRCGEDVDLVWRLHDAGWSLRYDPDATVHHHEPSRWLATLRRRRFYGTSVGPLSRRHPSRVAHLTLTPAAVGVVGGLLAGQPLVAAAVAVLTGARLSRRLRALGAPPAVGMGLAAESMFATSVGLARGATMLGWPALVLHGLTGRRRAAAVAAVVLAPGLLDWLGRRNTPDRPDLDPLTWAVLSVVDDVAYGSGVLAACARARTLDPLRPRLARAR